MSRVWRTVHATVAPDPFPTSPRGSVGKSEGDGPQRVRSFRQNPCLSMNWPVCRGASLPLVYPDYIASRLSSHVGPLIIRNSEYSTLKGPFLQKKTNKQKKLRWKQKEGPLFQRKLTVLPVAPNGIHLGADADIGWALGSQSGHGVVWGNAVAVLNGINAGHGVWAYVKRVGGSHYSRTTEMEQWHGGTKKNCSDRAKVNRWATILHPCEI
jgi:hypothetical protein